MNLGETVGIGGQSHARPDYKAVTVSDVALSSIVPQSGYLMHSLTAELKWFQKAILSDKRYTKDSNFEQKMHALITETNQLALDYEPLNFYYMKELAEWLLESADDNPENIKRGRALVRSGSASLLGLKKRGALSRNETLGPLYQLQEIDLKFVNLLGKSVGFSPSTQINYRPEELL